FLGISSFLFYQLCDHIANLSEPLGARPRFYEADASVSVDQNRGGQRSGPIGHLPPLVACHDKIIIQLLRNAVFSKIFQLGTRISGSSLDVSVQSRQTEYHQ